MRKTKGREPYMIRNGMSVCPDCGFHQVAPERKDWRVYPPRQCWECGYVYSEGDAR